MATQALAVDPNAEIYDAIRRADAAGDSAAVAKLAGYLKEQETGAAAPQEAKTRTNADGSIDEQGEDGTWYTKSGPPEAPEMGYGDQLKRSFGLAGRAALDGFGQLTDFVSAPLRAIDALDSYITPNRVRGEGGSATDAARNLADWLGLPTPQNNSERFVNATGAGITGGLLTAGAGSVAGIPALAGAAQAIGGGGAAAGGELARQNGAGTAGQIAASLVGGVAPIAAGHALPQAAKLIGNEALDLGRKVFSSITKEGAYDRAAQLLRNATTGSVDDVVENIAARAPQVSGAQPTLAEVAGDTGIAGFQRGHANTDLPTQAAVAERHNANALARTRTASEAMGEGTPQAIQDVAQQEVGAAERATVEQQASRQAAVDERIASEQSAATSARETAEAGLGGAREAVGPTVDRSATGAAARDQFEAAHTEARAKTREAYNNPELTKPQPIEIEQPVFAKIRDAAEDFYGDGGGIIPARLQEIISDLAEPRTTTRTLTNIDRRLADFAGEAKMAGRRSEAAFAERLRGNLGDFVERAAPKPYRDALANAKALRAEQGRVFETGDAPRAFGRDQYRNPVVGDTTVPSRLIRPGGPGGDTIDGLIAAIGPEAAETSARQELRRAIEEGNVQTGAQVRALATKFGEVAGRFPTLRDDLENLRAHAEALDNARSAETMASRASATREELASIRENSALQDEIAKSPLGRIASPDVDPGSFVGGLLRRTDGGRQLRQLDAQVGKNPQARAGIRRALGDFIVKAGRGSSFNAAGDQIPSINKTREAIDTVLTRAGPMLEKEQRLVLRLINRELEGANFAATAAKPAGSETAINKSFKELIDQAPGGGMAKSMLKRVAALLDNGDQVKALITQSILDPDFAATLLKRATPKHWEVVKGGISKASLASAGVFSLDRAGSGLQQRLSDVAKSGGSQSLAASPPEAGENVQDTRAEVPQQKSDDGSYQQWLKQYGIREDPTYDTRAAFEAGLKPDARGHLDDTYKQPNHPTFSDESVHNGEGGKVGGKWVDLGNDKWEFRASDWNLKNMSKQELKAYFDRVEPGTTVVFPDGERYTGKGQ